MLSSARAQLRLTLRRAAPLHATCTESLPLFRVWEATIRVLYNLSTTLRYKGISASGASDRVEIGAWETAHVLLRCLPTAIGYPGMLRKIGTRNMNETARRWR